MGDPTRPTAADSPRAERPRRPTAAAPLAVQVCEGLPCALAGAADLLQALPAAIGREARVLSAPCLGRCEQAPAALVGEHAVPCADTDRVAQAVQDGTHQAEPEGYIGLSQYRAAGGYRLLAQCLRGERTAEAVVATLEASGLGAPGTPAAALWRAARTRPAPRVLAVAAGRGEAGHFGDRVVLERDPHRVLEGLLVAAWALEASRVEIHLREAWHGVRKLLEQELARLQADPPCPGLPAIVLHRAAGPGSDIAPAGSPAPVHALDILHWVRDIVDHGADWFRHKGTGGQGGLRSFAVSGRVQAPGLRHAPAGTTLHELIDEHCGGMRDGHALQAWVPAGGGLRPASAHDLPLEPTGTASGAMAPGASLAVVVLSEHDSVTAAAANLLRARSAACGPLCAACEAGTRQLLALLAQPLPPAPGLAGASAAMRAGCSCGAAPALATPGESLVQDFAQHLAPG